MRPTVRNLKKGDVIGVAWQKKPECSEVFYPVDEGTDLGFRKWAGHLHLELESDHFALVYDSEDQSNRISVFSKSDHPDKDGPSTPSSNGPYYDMRYFYFSESTDLSYLDQVMENLLQRLHNAYGV